MTFSKTSEYALQVMSLMACDETRLYRADDIYDSLKIPYRYLRRLMTGLVKSGLIASIQGKSGGYRIARSLATITLMDVLVAAGENFFTDKCFFGFGKCALSHSCMMHEKWISIRESISRVLITSNLEEIKKHGPAAMGPVKQMFNQ